MTVPAPMIVTVLSTTVANDEPPTTLYETGSPELAVPPNTNGASP